MRIELRSVMRDVVGIDRYWASFGVWFDVPPVQAAGSSLRSRYTNSRVLAIAWSSSRAAARTSLVAFGKLWSGLEYLLHAGNRCISQAFVQPLGRDGDAKISRLKHQVDPARLWVSQPKTKVCTNYAPSKACWRRIKPVSLAVWRATVVNTCSRAVAIYGMLVIGKFLR